MEQQHIASQTASQANYDAKKYICGPWIAGRTGGPWNEVFEPHFLDALRGKKDHFTSYYAHFVSETGVGAANGPAHPAGAGLVALSFQSRQAYEVRQDECYNLILSHVGYDQDIKDQIKTHVANTLTGAPTRDDVTAADAAIAAAVAANAAAVIAGNPVVPVPPAATGVAGELPNDWVAQLWQFCQTLGQARPSGLLTLSQNSDFDNIKLTDVGIDRNTISRFKAHLERVNRQRTIPKNINDVWIKFLSQITFPKMLSDEAIRQLQTPTFIIPAPRPNAGSPDLQALANNFEELWQTIYDRGIEIKPQAAPKPPAERSNRVDGMMNAIVHNSPRNFGNMSDLAVSQGMMLVPSDTSHGYNWTGITDAELHEAYIVSTSSEAFAFVKDERNCWICKGYGHTKDKCPSDPKVKRPIEACISGLQALKSAEAARGQQRPFKPRRFIRRPGASPAGRAKAMEVASIPQDDLETFIQYDDGAVYSMDGVMVTGPQPTSEHVPDVPDAAKLESNCATTMPGTAAAAAPPPGALPRKRPAFPWRAARR